MQGADDYYDLFNGKSQQIGRLFFQLSTHARGKCFEIFLLPKGVEAKGSTIGGVKDIVEVYGMTGGQRGWTETYGWLHKGKWQDDFSAIVEQKKVERETNRLKYEEKIKAAKEQKEGKVNGLLSSYV